MAEQQKPYTRWDAPFQDKTEKAAHAFAEAAKGVLQPDRPAGKVVGSVKDVTRRVFGFDKVYSDTHLPGFENPEGAEPIQPREGTNLFDLRAKLRANAQDLHTESENDFELTDDLPAGEKARRAVSEGVQRVRAPLARLVVHATGLDKDYSEIQYIKLVDSSNRTSKLPADDQIGETSERRLAELGTRFQQPVSEVDQDRALMDARVIFEIHHPPSKIVKYKRR